MIDRNGYLNGVVRDLAPPRPSRPPSPTAVPDDLAPDGHTLEVEVVEPYVSEHGTHMPAFDRCLGRCACGESFDGRTMTFRGNAVAVVGAWIEHLDLDRDTLLQLRRDLTDAEAVARWGRPYHRRTPA